jgi:hypothetical protein
VKYFERKLKETSKANTVEILEILSFLPSFVNEEKNESIMEGGIRWRGI